MIGRERLEGTRAGISIGERSAKRPAGEWTPTVHSFLNYLHDSFGLNVPKPIELNKQENYKILSFVDGESFDYPLPEKFLNDDLLQSAARLLKKMHDASVPFLNQFAVNSEHGRQRIRRPVILALWIISGYFLLQLFPWNQTVHPLQKDLATGFAPKGASMGTNGLPIASEERTPVPQAGTPP